MNPQVEEERNGLRSRLRRIVAKAESEGRDLHPDEAEMFDRLEAKLVELEEKPAPDSTRPLIGTSTSTGGPKADPMALTPEQRVADWAKSRPSRGFTAEDAEEFSLGRAIVGACTGNWAGADLEQRALAEGTGAAGGFLTPELLSGQFIDRVRNQTRVLQAGATTIPLESDQQSIARLATGVTGAWRNENTAVIQSDPVFERVTFAAEDAGGADAALV